MGSGSSNETGSESLSVHYGKTPKLMSATSACLQAASATVELYSTVLWVHPLPEHTDVTIMTNTELLYDICWCSEDIEGLCCNVNWPLASIISTPTAPLLFDGALNVDSTEYQTNLVPYPCIRFLL